MTADTEVRWQTRIKCASEGIRHIHDTKEFCDVKIRVQGKVFEAHKLILAARSSEFARLLMSPMATDEIIVDRSSPVTVNGFKVLLHFIYRNELNTSDKKSIIEGYLAAKYFKQKALQTTCTEEIESWEIKHDEVCDLLDIECDIAALEERCMSVVRSNGMAVISSDSFTKASFKTVSAILRSGALKDVPVFERIKFVMKWGKNNLMHESASDYTPVREKLLNTEPPLLGMLEFEKLNVVTDLPQIYSDYAGLLKFEECPRFLEYSAKKDSSKLPSWCTTAK